MKITGVKYIKVGSLRKGDWIMDPIATIKRPMRIDHLVAEPLGSLCFVKIVTAETTRTLLTDDLIVRLGVE